MRKTLFGLLFIVIIFFIFSEFFLKEHDNIVNQISSNLNSQEDETEQERSGPDDLAEEVREVVNLKTASLHHFIGAQSEVVEEIYSTPNRIEPSSYGYDWWVYKISDEMYIQFGIQHDKVVTIYATGNDIYSKPFNIGDSYTLLNEELNFERDVSSVGSQFFQFKLTSEEIKSKPLIQFENIWVQLYFDSFTNKLSSIRYLDEKTLLKQRPYSITYRGSLPEVEDLTNKDWEQIERGMELQVFDITNIIRLRHGLEKLEWHDKVSNVAYLHSEDMSIHNYFSHTSPNKGELSDRLSEMDVRFQIAGENIAANYVDAACAVEGWLNSEGHRVNLLSNEFTHLGVGVYEKYYTQNFLTPWDVASLHGN